MDRRYPWYDNQWLACYSHAKELIERVQPEKLLGFVDSLDVLRTRPDFKVKELPEVFSDAVLEDIARVIRELDSTQLNFNEIKDFGRCVVRNHPLISELQKSLVGLATEAAGEPVEPRYNFLSLYSELGVCPMHMDAPHDAKWTLDLCIRQSGPWPIQLSQVVPWPEDFEYDGDDWHEAIKRDPALRFDSYSLEPGRAIFFSGSSQWHYRDPHPGGDGDQSCELLFFHFIPKGTREKSNPANWARVFGIAELAEISSNYGFG